MLPLFSRTVKFGNITYSLYSHSLLHFGLVIINLFSLLSMFLRLIINHKLPMTFHWKVITTYETCVLMLLLISGDGNVHTFIALISYPYHKVISSYWFLLFQCDSLSSHMANHAFQISNDTTVFDTFWLLFILQNVAHDSWREALISGDSNLGNYTR